MSQSESARGYRARAQEWLEAVRALPTPEPAKLDATQLAGMIDHTLLKADAMPEAVDTLCGEAQEYGFASVCVNSRYVPRCAAALARTPVKVCAVVGFPLGANLAEVKAWEAERSLALGAREIDMVIPVGLLRAGDYALVRHDIDEVVKRCRRAGGLCKVILETALLSDEEKVIACLLSVEAGAEFVKTSTGFASAGATLADVQLMRAVVGPEVGVKAAGGIRTLGEALAMVGAGASRIGASAGVKIIQEARGG